MWPGVGAAEGTQLLDAQILDPASQPLEEGVIVASLWPSRDARRAMKPGDIFHLVPIDRIDVVRGRAPVHVASPDLLRSHTSSDGIVKVHLDVFTPDGMTTVVLLERRLSGSGHWIDASVDPDAALVDSVSRVQLDKSHMAELRLPSVPTTAPLTTRHHQGATCSAIETLGRAQYPHTVATVGLYKGVKGKIVYTESATSTIGLGVQMGVGPWSQSSMTTRTSTFQATSTTRTGSSTAWTNLEWRVAYAHWRDYRHCVDPADTTYPYNDQWVVQRFTEPDAVGGTYGWYTSRYALQGCHTKWPLRGTQEAAADAATAMTYNQAFTISFGPTSFGGQSRSGYNGSTKIVFTEPAADAYWYWCGDQYYPKQSAWVRAGR
jgi:hypothetical protein